MPLVDASSRKVVGDSLVIVPVVLEVPGFDVSEKSSGARDDTLSSILSVACDPSVVRYVPFKG